MTIEKLLAQPKNSLVNQSRSARKCDTPTNGDGFGVGWYGTRKNPGVYRDVFPAWNDANLLSLTSQIESTLFFAHVRSSTGTATSRENCHPFVNGNWMFMHNGEVGGYWTIKREIEWLLRDQDYQKRIGTTDSEAIFLLLCSNGLATDVRGALCKTVRQILDFMSSQKIKAPLLMTAAISDGERLYALRFSSNNQSPTLYYTTGGKIDVVEQVVSVTPGTGANLILSEPLDDTESNWTAVPEAHLLVIENGIPSVEAFDI